MQLKVCHFKSLVSRVNLDNDIQVKERVSHKWKDFLGNAVHLTELG